jgi:diketogulonate reductase-like aldo/keto reductase
MTLDVPRYTLNDGQSVPVIGFGTYPLRGDDGVEAIAHALEAGYRLLDTAVNYGNEEQVGEAVRRSGLAREDVQVTSKIPGRHHDYDQAIGSVEESLRRMRFDYLDRVLIHWPNPSVGKYVEAGSLDRGQQLHRAASPRGHRGHRRDPRSQPGRAAPVLPPAGDAARAHRPRHPDGGVEPARQAQCAVR